MISSLVKYGVFPVFEEGRALVFASELDERGGVRLPVHRKVLEVLEDRIDADLAEQADRVVSVLVEVGVEDPLVHEPRVIIEEHSAKVVELERREHVGVSLQRFRGELIPFRFSATPNLAF